MKKIVFCTMSLQSLKPIYSAQQEDFHDFSDYQEKVYYPINVVLANTLQKEDDVKIVLIKTKDEERLGWEKLYNENKEKFLGELKKINEKIGAKINIDSPFEIETEFKEMKDIFEERFMNFFSVLEEDTEIYADVTFGPRPLSFIQMNVLNFAEKFFNADIQAVVYGKTSFITTSEGKTVPTDNGTVYDLSALHYMNNLTNAVRAKSGNDAVEAFKSFLTL